MIKVLGFIGLQGHKMEFLGEEMISTVFFYHWGEL